MDNFILKWTAFGFSYEEWANKNDLLPWTLISVIEAWRRTVQEQDLSFKQDIKDDFKREYGRIINAYYGLESDVHNLSINYHLIKSISMDKEQDNGLKILYVGLLSENYITNLRSIYDFTSLFPRILIEDIKHFKKLQNLKNSDSLNSLISFARSDNNYVRNIFSESVLSIFKKVENDLNDIRLIRDTIIHKGKEPIIEFENGKYFIRIPLQPPFGVGNNLPDILSIGNDKYPLLDYLKVLTIRLLNYMEDLAQCLYKELHYKRKDFIMELCALVGICIPDFREYIEE